MAPQRIQQAKATRISASQRLDLLTLHLSLGGANRVQSSSYVWHQYVEQEQSDNHEHCDGCWARIAEGDWGDNFEYAWWSDSAASWLCPQCHPFLEGYEAGLAGLDQ